MMRWTTEPFTALDHAAEIAESAETPDVLWQPDFRSLQPDNGNIIARTGTLHALILALMCAQAMGDYLTNF
jgi:hypothetical protein